MPAVLKLISLDLVPEIDLIDLYLLHYPQVCVFIPVQTLELLRANEAITISQAASDFGI